MFAYKKLYLTKGILKVKARGYWFTSGGEKGSFGYYPHLKDRDGYPVYPDTQIHGDLRMSAKWLKNISSSNDDLINKVFGKEGNETSSLLYLTDLELSCESKKKWQIEWFDVKPKVEIEDETRTNKEHMLVNIEMAYLKGLELESKVYLGYFDDEKELNEAKILVTQAAEFLNGFGAYRSRGYGRGDISMEWFETEIVEFKKTNSVEEFYPYFLKSLVNMRNKPIEPGRTQLAESTKYITSEQLRGWFVRAYHRLFGEYPIIEEISSINFPYCYPSICDNNRTAFGYPPPLSTLKNEKDEIEDFTGRHEQIKEGLENFFNFKPKPLPSNMFVTNEDSPSVIEVKSEKRIRNSIEDNFKTKGEGGLFVQECIKRGIIFGGLISLNKENPEFLKKAVFILNNMKPVINGTIFEWILTEISVDRSSEKIPYLVTQPLPFSKGLLNNTNQIILTTARRYNTTLRRPRRNRIVISQGSVINKMVDKNLISWKGLGKEIKYEKPVQKRPEGERVDAKRDDLEEMEQISRAQSGQLREFFNHDAEFITKKIEHILKKYEGKTKDARLIPANVLKKIQGLIIKDGLESAKKYIKGYLDVQLLKWWGQKADKVKSKLDKEKAEFKKKNETNHM